MKVKVMRASGHPIKLSEIEAYKQDWRELYDRVQRKCQVGEDAAGFKSVDILRMQKLLARVEQSLMKKYNRVEEWDLLDSPKAMSDKIDEFGNIMLTKRADSDELLYVILDEDMIQNLT